MTKRNNLMLPKQVLIILAIFAAILCAGCAQPPVTNASSELPDPATARVEAKAALAEWQALLETGQNQAFLQASMPPEIYELAITENGSIAPEVRDRIRAFAPRIVNALNEAGFVEPEIEGNNVVFEFDTIHNTSGFFQDEKIILTKRDGRWQFNGKMLKEIAANRN